ncbi:MAG: two-component system response regulator [Verrucomicrobiales bacterium]|nr:two-component system response regulator [Verrucomicrobiales bacterium]
MLAHCMAGKSNIKVAFVEDDPEEFELLNELLKKAPGFECVGAFSSAEPALKQIPAAQPEVILMDIHLPGMSGISAVRQLKAVSPKARVMMFTIFENHDRIFEALRAGASGYLLKKTPPAQILKAIQELYEGGAPMSAPIARQVVAAFHEQTGEQSPAKVLSTREQEILGLLNKGLLYKEIADRLGIAVGTVRTHIAHIYDKLHVSNRAEAMLKAIPRLP